MNGWFWFDITAAAVFGYRAYKYRQSSDIIIAAFSSALAIDQYRKR